MARYLVTGRAGFIGSHLTEVLLRVGQEVCVLDNLSTGRRGNVPANADFILGDIRDQSLLREVMAQVDGCFHLAAIASVQASTEHWWETHQINLGGAVNVFEAASGATGGPLPVVYASSAAVYGDCPRSPLAEDAPARPLTAYGADKLGCELHARAGATTHGLGSIGLRFFNVYGPRQDPRSPYSGVISVFAERFLNNAPVAIHGDGEQTRDFVYVGDVCAALWSAMLHVGPGAAEAYNVCTGREVSVRQLADTICRLVGSSARVTHGDARPGDIRRSIGDPQRLVARLGKGPAMPLEAGLKLTLEWMKVSHGQLTQRAEADVAA